MALNKQTIEIPVTFVQAIAMCYDFNPRKKKGSSIMFRIEFEDTPDKPFEFGKSWSKLDHDWHFFEHDKFCPYLQCEEKHFVSNLFARTPMHNEMTYSAQQGRPKVFLTNVYIGEKDVTADYAKNMLEINKHAVDYFWKPELKGTYRHQITIGDVTDTAYKAEFHGETYEGLLMNKQFIPEGFRPARVGIIKTGYKDKDDDKNLYKFYVMSTSDLVKV